MRLVGRLSNFLFLDSRNKHIICSSMTQVSPSAKPSSSSSSSPDCVRAFDSISLPSVKLNAHGNQGPNERFKEEEPIFYEARSTPAQDTDFVIAKVESPTKESDQPTSQSEIKAMSQVTTPLKDSNDEEFPIHVVRDQLLKLQITVGQLSALFLEHVPMDPIARDTKSTDQQQADEKRTLALRQSISSQAVLDITSSMSQLLSTLIATASLLSIDLRVAIVQKMELNGRKYPVELCKGKAGKYTEYSDATGITKEKGQETVELSQELSGSGTNADTNKESSSASALEEAIGVLSRSGDCGKAEVHELQVAFDDCIPMLTSVIRQFATERLWSRYHLPRNLILALSGELGELCELFQWRPDVAASLTRDEKDKMGQELADVSIYLLRLADVCEIPIAAVAP